MKKAKHSAQSGRIAVLVGLDGSYLVVFTFEGHDALAEVDVHTVLLELSLDHLGKFRVEHIEQAVERLDDVNLGNLLQNAGFGKLQTNIAAADNDDALGIAFEGKLQSRRLIERFEREDILLTDAGDRRDLRRRAGRDEELIVAFHMRLALFVRIGNGLRRKISARYIAAEPQIDAAGQKLIGLADAHQIEIVVESRHIIRQAACAVGHLVRLFQNDDLGIRGLSFDTGSSAHTRCVAANYKEFHITFSPLASQSGGCMSRCRQNQSLLPRRTSARPGQHQTCLPESGRPR